MVSICGAKVGMRKKKEAGAVIGGLAMLKILSGNQLAIGGAISRMRPAVADLRASLGAQAEFLGRQNPGF